MSTEVLIFLVVFLGTLVVLQMVLFFFTNSRKNNELNHIPLKLESLTKDFMMWGERFEEKLLQHSKNLVSEEGLRMRSDFMAWVSPQYQAQEKILREQFLRLEQGLNHQASTLLNFESSLSKIFEERFHRLKEVFGEIEKQFTKLQFETRSSLESMRILVEEKMEKVLENRLRLSFESLFSQLQSMQVMMSELGSTTSEIVEFKKIFLTVKTKGIWGEWHLEALLSEVLSKGQYARQLKLGEKDQFVVDFAVKIPRKDRLQKELSGSGSSGEFLWLPIDCKFPLSTYEEILKKNSAAEAEIHERTLELEGSNEKKEPLTLREVKEVEKYQKLLDSQLKKMAKDISEKYIRPPATTDFALLYLPLESLYASVVQNLPLVEEMYQKYRVIPCGPTTMLAFLSSARMGLYSLEIEARTHDLARRFRLVEHEFDQFIKLLQKAQKHLGIGVQQIDELIEVRSKSFRKKLATSDLDDSEDRSSGLLKVTDDITHQD